MLGLTFKSREDEDIKDYAEKHFKELEKFNEQLSTVTTEFARTQINSNEFESR